MAQYSYPKSNRLRKPPEFKIVFDKPLFKIHHTHFMVFVANTKHQEVRLGMAITKKKIPKAVDRNRIKRLIKDQFRHQIEMLPALDIVFILKKPTQHLTNQQLSQEVNEVLSKIKSRYNKRYKS